MKTLLTFLGCVACAGIGGLVGTQYPASLSHEPTYDLVLQAKDGNEYVIDFNLTRDDCSSRLVSFDEFDWENTKQIYCDTTNT